LDTSSVKLAGTRSSRAARNDVVYSVIGSRSSQRGEVAAAAEKKTPPLIIKLAPGGEPRGEGDVCPGVERSQQARHIGGIVR